MIAVPDFDVHYDYTRVSVAAEHCLAYARLPTYLPTYTHTISLLRVYCVYAYK